MSKVTVHNGPHTAIPSNTSPGFLFLRNFIPVFDSLDALDHPIAQFLAPDASIIVGNWPVSHGDRLASALEARGKHLAHYRRDVEVAWDIEHNSTSTSERGDGKRTVMFEATSVTVFKNDPDQFEVKVKEFNILELVPSTASLIAKKVGSEGLLVREIRTYMDARPVQDHASRLRSQSAFAETKSQY